MKRGTHCKKGRGTQLWKFVQMARKWWNVLAFSPPRSTHVYTSKSVHDAGNEASPLKTELSPQFLGVEEVKTWKILFLLARGHGLFIPATGEI